MTRGRRSSQPVAGIAPSCIARRNGVQASKFLAWMECNTIHPDARLLTYAQFPTKFVWKREKKSWKKRKKGEFVVVSTIYILDATSYKDIRTVNGITYPTFKDACYHMGTLDDEREYIDGITEASSWGTAHYLRSLFTMLLLSNTLSRPFYIWEKTWHLLSDDVLFKQRRILQIEDLQLSEKQLKNYALA
ncbi:hypothetical protein V2J09_003989 [Rumex salicifolius]